MRGPPKSGFSALLRHHRDQVLERWCQRVLRDPAVPEARDLSRPALRDHIPALLDRLIAALDAQAAAAGRSEPLGWQIGSATESRSHAEQRFTEAYSLPAVLRELSHLRAAVLDLSSAESVPAASEELLLVHSVLDQAMTTAAEAIHQAALKELVASEERYRLLVDSAKDYAIFLLDAEGRVASWSGAQWLKGYAAAEILGHPFRIFFTPEEQVAGAPEQALRTALGEGRFMGRLVFLRKGGARFWAELMLTPLSDESGRLRGYSCITRDVTEQVAAAAERAHLLESERAARQEAERSEFKFRRLADSGILGIIISKGSGAILEANDEFLRMVGYSRDDLAHGRLLWLAMTPPEHLPLDERALWELRTLGSARPYEKEHVCKDGSRVAVALGVATLSQQEDTYIAYVLDITARKRAEAALRQVAIERDETLALLDTFMASAPVGFALIDRRLTYLRINEALAEMNGLPVAAHLGRRLREVLQGLEPLEELVQHVFSSEEPVLGLRAEAPGSAPGEPRHVLANFHPIRDTSGQVYAVGGIVVDITAQVQAMEEIQRDAAFRERLLAILGHDLRQPLSTISMTAEAWLLQEGLPENLLRSAQRLARAAARMGRMISDLLDFARVRQQSGLPLAPRPIDLGAVCRTVVEEITMAHPSRQIELQAQDGCEGQWDPDRIAQVISNLVSNALDYSPPDTPASPASRARAPRSGSSYLRPSERAAPLTRPRQLAYTGHRTLPGERTGAGSARRQT